MASSFTFILLSTLLVLSPALAKTSFRPKALVLPVTKDPKTLQYLTHLNQRTPLVPVSLTLDLGGQLFWVDCEQAYVSSTYRFPRCHSAQCSLAGSKLCGECFSSPQIGCNNNTCLLMPENRITGPKFPAELSSDIVSIQSTDGSNPGRAASVPRFLFACTGQVMLYGLADGVKGVAGLGRYKISLPSQLSAAFSFARKFGICLSSGTGVVIFGDGPYVLLPGIDVTKKLMYTPLIRNPVGTIDRFFAHEGSTDYYIGVKSIKINEKDVPINKTLLSIDKEGRGGTMISSINPYTVLETSIYKAVTKFFAKELAGIRKAKAVAPFKLCYKADDLGSTRVGAAVPPIDLVLQNENVTWRIFGANSMVNVKDDILCLGVVEAEEETRASIMIGGHTIEDNLLQFDLARSRLGFSSSLLFGRTTCANFNFTSNA
ncbi:Nepenthesin [Bertholletia excelsa]